MSWIVRMAAPDDPVTTDAVIARLWDLGSTGVAEIGPPAVDGPQLLAGFDDDATAARVADALGGTVERVAEVVVEPPPGLVRLDGPPTVVVAHPDRLDDAEAHGSDLTLTIEAGPTFGHGAHPTTHLALEAVLGLADTLVDATVLDVGAGSGVLGILAARLGAGVVATEIDPAAHEWIGRNAAANDAEIEVGPTDLTGHDPVDVALVNVLLPVHREVAADVVRLARRHIVVTGVRDDQVDEVVELYGRTVLEDRSRDAWRLLLLDGTPT